MRVIYRNILIEHELPCNAILFQVMSKQIPTTTIYIWTTTFPPTTLVKTVKLTNKPQCWIDDVKSSAPMPIVMSLLTLSTFLPNLTHRYGHYQKKSHPIISENPPRQNLRLQRLMGWRMEKVLWTICANLKKLMTTTKHKLQQWKANHLAWPRSLKSKVPKDMEKNYQFMKKSE